MWLNGKPAPHRRLLVFASLGQPLHCKEYEPVLSSATKITSEFALLFLQINAFSFNLLLERGGH